MNFKNLELKEYVGSGENVLFNQSVDFKDGFSTYSENFLITNKKLVHADGWAVTTIPLNGIKSIRLKDDESNNFIFEVDEYSFRISKKQEDVALKMYKFVSTYIGY